MKKITIGILAHVDAGKTTLSESFFYQSGIIKKMGRVDKKESLLDYEQMERERGITVFSKEGVFKWKNTSFNLIDTPGHVDFTSEMERSLQILDYAILVINAREGIQSHTRTIFKLLEHFNVPTIIFVNKMDMAYHSSKELLKQIQNELSPFCFDATDADFQENISLLDDSYLDAFLENGDIGQYNMENAFKNRLFFPCVFGSALKNDHISFLLDFMDQYCVAYHQKEKLEGIVYKITYDQNTRLTHILLRGGSLNVKDEVHQKEKIHQIRIYHGNKFDLVQTAYEGDIIAVTGLQSLEIGMDLNGQYILEKPQIVPFLSYRIVLPDDCNQSDAITKLRNLSYEDPNLHFHYESKINELRIQVMGEIQLEILKQMIFDRYQLSVTFDMGQISYYETISQSVEGVGHFEPLKHYSEVHLLLEPLPRGSGLQFYLDCSPNQLSLSYQNACLHYLKESYLKGVLIGGAITDMKITVINGKAHQKHTEGGDFKEATLRALRQGLKKAKSIILEPYYAFKMTFNQEYMSKVIFDLELMDCKFEIIQDEMVVIKGTGPVSKMIDYPLRFKDSTKGSGHLSYQLDGYYEVNNQEEVINQIHYNSEEDPYYPTGSVFCKNGSGFYVPWNQVEQYMHLPLKKTYQPQENKHRQQVIDEKELEEIFIRTYGPIKHRLSKDMNRKIKKINNEKVTILPECLLIDGYNVIFSWDELKDLAKDNLDAARMKLIDMMCNYQGYKNNVLILVFDAYKVKKNDGFIEKYDNIFLVYTKEAQTADMYIERVTHDLAKNFRVVVVTSDALEQLIVSGRGATRMSSREFEMIVSHTHKENYDEFKRKNKVMKNYLLDDFKGDE